MRPRPRHGDFVRESSSRHVRDSSSRSAPRSTGPRAEMPDSPRGHPRLAVETPHHPDWILVPTRTFGMGGGERREENPRHTVRVDAFRLARTQVTRLEYQAFLDDAGHESPEFWDQPEFGHSRMPAVGPSWNDAVAYCGWLSTRIGEIVRLPTEAEWESAARWGREVLYPHGNSAPETLADYATRWQDGPEPVDLYPSRHPAGFFGLGENVHEWCSDWFDARYYEVSCEHNPRGPERGRRRSSRGGSWRHAVKVSRCVARSSIPPSFRYSDYGFRVASDP